MAVANTTTNGARTSPTTRSTFVRCVLANEKATKYNHQDEGRREADQLTGAST